MEFIQSRNVNDYAPAIQGLTPTFGPVFQQCIDMWCRQDYEEEASYWNIWLATVDNEVIGICGLYSLNESNDELWLGWFGVVPDKRKKGLGSCILKFVTEQASSVGCKILRSYVEGEGKPLPFYEKRGLKVIGKVKDYLRANPRYIGEFGNDQDWVIEKEIT